MKDVGHPQDLSADWRSHSNGGGRRCLERMDGIRLRVEVDWEDVHQAVRWHVDPPTAIAWSQALPARALPEDVRTPHQAIAWCDEHLPMAPWMRSFGARTAA